MGNYFVSGSIVAKLKLRTSYLSSTEVMEILRRSRKTLCAWVKAGDIPANRVGRDNMFDSWELALWIEERQLGQRAHASGKGAVLQQRNPSHASSTGPAVPRPSSPALAALIFRPPGETGRIYFARSIL